MEYSFGSEKVVSEKKIVFEYPVLYINDAKKYGNFFKSEITNIANIEYLNKIVNSLQQLKNKTLDTYDFGYEVYIIICDHEFCRCVDSYKITEEKFPDPDSVIPIDEVLQLMIDWTNYVTQWKKEHNKS